MSKYGQGLNNNVIEIVSIGDTIQVVHKWSKEKRDVTIIGITEKHVSVNWPMCGHYDVNLKTGELKSAGGKKKGATLWMIDPKTFEKIQNSIKLAEFNLHERVKKNKSR